MKTLENKAPNRIFPFRFYRDGLGVTQKEVADEVGMTVQSYNAIEKFTLDDLKKISVALGIDSDLIYPKA